ncbi:MAG: RNA polymerase sigma factor [Myxococcota bacterium]
MSDSSESSKFAELEQQARALLEQGDVGAAAEVVVRALGPELLGYLHAVAPSPDEADEVFSGYCERLLGGLANFRGDSTIRTWSYRVIRNLLIGGWRARQRDRVRSPLTGELSRVAAQVRSRTASYLQTEAKDRLTAIREQLPEEDRTLLVLRVDRQLPWKEIAAIMLDDPDRAAVARLRKRFERLVVRLRDQMKA